MIIYTHVKPNKHTTKIIATDDGFIIELKAKPIDGAANTELLETLADYFEVPKTHIKILRGATSSHKTVEIPDII